MMLEIGHLGTFSQSNLSSCFRHLPNMKNSNIKSVSMTKYCKRTGLTGKAQRLLVQQPNYLMAILWVTPCITTRIQHGQDGRYFSKISTSSPPIDVTASVNSCSWQLQRQRTMRTLGEWIFTYCLGTLPLIFIRAWGRST